MSIKINHINNGLRKFSIEEYTGLRSNGIRATIEEMRSYFLYRVSNKVPKVSEDLIGNLLVLYKKIPLFYFGAKEKALPRSFYLQIQGIIWIIPMAIINVVVLPV
jgi:hypothetical protein